MANLLSVTGEASHQTGEKKTRRQFPSLLSGTDKACSQSVPSFPRTQWHISKAPTLERKIGVKAPLLK